MFKAVILAAVLAWSFVSAQNTPALPTCVSSCITSAATIAGCSSTDTTCLCSSSSLFPQTVGTCLGTQCNATEITAGRNAVLSLCGIISSASSATSTSRPASSSTSPASSSATVTSPAVAAASAASSSTRPSSASVTSASASASSRSNAMATNVPAHLAIGGMGLAAALFVAA